MDELELAKKAVRRGLLTEEQLREARAFAEGGRSLVAVLLDLGYLKPQHLLELGEPPSPPPPAPARSGTVGWLLVAAAVGILGLVIGRSCASPRPRYETRYLPSMPAVESAASAVPPAPLGRTLLVRANEILGVAEERAAKEPSLSTETEGALLHAAALLEEALVPSSSLPRESRRHALYALARAQELAGRWETAFKSYTLALKENPAFFEARLGAARVKLLLEDAAGALALIDPVCGEASAPAEAFLVRAKARLALGDGIKARKDLESAKRNPSLSGEIDRVLRRLNE